MADYDWMSWQCVYRPTATQRTGLVVLLLAVLAVLVVNAWIAEDAFITFRVIDNASHGYGLRWNIDERVQVYTHPLWMLALLGAHAVTNEIYLTSIAVSLFLTMMALAIGAFGIARSFGASVFLLAAAVMASPFVDFAAAGLESPLAYMLIAVFFWLLVRPSINILWLSLTASLLILTRHDLLLLIMPALVWVVWRQRSYQAIGFVSLGMLPVIAWELFSLVYYGFLFPNTAYAKINVGIPHKELLMQGFRYLTDVVVNHPLVTGMFIAGEMSVDSRRRIAGRMMMYGVLLYLAYVVWVGGDFMTGRFVVLPYWVVVLVCAHYWPKDKSMQHLMFVGLLVLGIFSVRPIWASLEKQTYAEDTYRFNGIADEKSFYFRYTGLVQNGRASVKKHYWVKDALFERTWTRVVVRGNVGLYGYYAGPVMHIVDPFALTDPLLSRLSDLDTSQWERTTVTKWRIGHFRRKLPAGYIESVQSGENVIKNPKIAKLYDDLQIITKGPIWRWERFKKIFAHII